MPVANTRPPVAVARPERDCDGLRARELSAVTVLVRGVGEIDASNSARLLAYVGDHVRGYKQLVLDLSRLTFFGTAGFSVLETINKQCGGANGSNGSNGGGGIGGLLGGFGKTVGGLFGGLLGGGGSSSAGGANGSSSQNSSNLQLLQTQLQQLMQKRQQMFQTMSNILKSLHDTSMNTIRQLKA